MIYGNKLAKRVAQRLDAVYVEAEVQDAVVCVAVIAAHKAFDSGPEATPENLVYPGRLSQLGVHFP